MSELKPYIGPHPTDHTLTEYYLKSEADKVIAELEESHKMEVEQLLMEIVKLKADYQEACDRLQTANLIKDEQLAATRHQKYKRCLGLARWCSAELGMLVSTWESKIKYYKRWHKRWLELAEKFKPNKEAKDESAHTAD